jgi:hypothetical protein
MFMSHDNHLGTELPRSVPRLHLAIYFPASVIYQWSLDVLLLATSRDTYSG